MPGLIMPSLRSLGYTLLLSLLAFGDAVEAVHKNVPRPDPFVDPRHDPYNPLKYIASNALTAIAVVLVLIVGILQVWFIRKWGARWMMSMTIGAFTFALGLATRFGLHKNPQSHGLYIVEYLFVVLSPCAFIAADYVLLGRIASHLGTDQYLLVSSRKITITFVSSDVTTFLIQAIGGALSASGSANNPQLALTGSHVFLGGLAAQLASFVVFWVLYLIFLYRVKTQSPEIWSKDTIAGLPWYKNWLALAGALFISCIGILIRSGFRVVELSEGFQGRLATSEPLFYGLDTLPLFIAIAIYIPFWPGRFIPRDANSVAAGAPSRKSPVEGESTSEGDREKRSGSLADSGENKQ